MPGHYGKMDKKKSGGAKVSMSYPTGTTNSAKVSLSAQKTSPAKRNKKA